MINAILGLRLLKCSPWSSYSCRFHVRKKHKLIAVLLVFLLLSVIVISS